MSLSLSFHINFVQIAKDGQLHWAPRHAWQAAASEVFAGSQGPVLLSATDLELELNQHRGPTLDLVFPDGLSEWLTLQTGGGPSHRPSWLGTLLKNLRSLTFSEWNKVQELTRPTLWFYDRESKEQRRHYLSLPEATPHLHILEVVSKEDEVLSWGAAIADLYLAEKLSEEVRSFFQEHQHLEPSTATSEGVQPGLHSPLLGLPQALSGHLAGVESDNHLFLGWENFYFSYRDSLGVWRSQPLPLQPFHSFKVDPYFTLIPDVDGHLYLPVALSPGARPTLMDILLEHAAFPGPTPKDPLRLQDGLRTFFNLQESQLSTDPILKNALEEVYWLVEGLRTSEDCLVEGPLASLFMESQRPGFRTGRTELMEALFAEPGR